jgi:hypothetical protein
MTTRKVPKTEWQGYFDRVSNALEGKLAEIEVVSLALGDQVEAKWLPLLGIVYDPRSDIIEIALEGLDHMIHQPSDIAVEEGPAGLASMKVTDAAGIIQIVKLRDPVLLPAPTAPSSS